MKTLLLIAICISGLAVKAQVSGKVTDEKGLPIPGSVVYMYTNTQLSKTMLTDTAGYFNATVPGLNRLVITALGYKTDTILTAQRLLGIIRLQPLASVLSEVRILGRQALIRQETDRSIISVNDAIKKLAANGLEMVALAPGITISDNEDAILMSGKSDVQIMINDKPVKMTARDLAKMLKAVPVGAIKQMEFLSNPPAKYEVNGNTGIINIKTSSVIKGITGNLDLSTSQANHTWADLSGLLNYGTGKLAVSGYLAWHKGGYLTEHRKERQLNPGILNQYTRNVDKWSDPVFRVALDYGFNRNSTFGGIIEREVSTNTGSYDTYSQQGANSYLTSSREPNVRRWNTYNLNYRYSDTLGTELTIDLDRADFNKNSQISLLTDGQLPINYFTLTAITINTLKADYAHSWKNRLKAEVGLKMASVKTANSQDANRFHYSEQIRATYASLAKSYIHWGWQLGLRIEQTSANGESEQGIKPDTNYLNLLPSVYLTWMPNAKHHFRLALSRRIKRPDYGELQPFVYVQDPLQQQTGNPGLRVQRNVQAELTYTFKERITLVSTYSQTNDYLSTVYRQSGNTLIEMPDNTGRIQMLNFDLNYPIKVTKWWNMLNKINVGNDHFNGELFQGRLDQDKWRYQVSTSQRFLLPGKYQLQLSGRYTSASQNLIYQLQRSANVSASIARKVLKEQGSLRLGISDIFKTQRNYTYVNFGSLNYIDQGTFESRRVSLNFSWRFGNTKVRQTEERNRGDADEKGRSGS